MSQEDVDREAAIAKAIDDRFKKIEAVVFAQPSEEKLEEVIEEIASEPVVTITDPTVETEPVTTPPTAE